MTDVSGNIVYEEGVDYRVFQSGQQTFLERISGTSIVNGQGVLVDYTHEREIGDVQERVRSYSLSIQWRFMEPYYRVSVKRVDLIEGPEETRLLLNPERSTVYGIILRERFWDRLTAEYRMERESNVQVLDPFRRITSSGSVDIDLGARATLLVFFRRSEIDHLDNGISTLFINSDSDSKTNGLEFRFAWQRLNGLITASEQDNTVGATVQEVSLQTARFELPYGRWVLETRLRHAHEELTDRTGNSPKFEKFDTLVSLGAKRFF